MKMRIARKYIHLLRNAQIHNLEEKLMVAFWLNRVAPNLLKFVKESKLTALRISLINQLINILLTLHA